ncbi:MAG: bifunctional (p)ppGpp synthetase/guanosine-3',5'-bis(diphosphate) 3'-pyrophosphohydrolase, partial [Lysobacteraceae bacterium]
GGLLDLVERAGKRMPNQVAQVLAHRLPDRRDSIDLALLGAQMGEKILITGAERGVVTFANCCMPIPGDDIMGYHTTGRGIVVHRTGCAHISEYRKSPERWVAIGWDREVSGDFQVGLRVEVDNRPGVLAQVAAAIAQADSNIDAVEYLDRDKNIAVIRFGIEVNDRVHLAEVIRRVRRLGVVHGIQRM